jgi:hypothetical protein
VQKYDDKLNIQINVTPHPDQKLNSDIKKAKKRYAFAVFLTQPFKHREELKMVPEKD